MEPSPRFDAVVELGRKLVKELELEDSVDTLGRWMAHHVAGLIDQATNSLVAEQATARRECFDAILRLWAHRNELPNGKRPFAELEPVMRAIESLDPEDDTPRYFRTARPRGKDDEAGAESQKWIELAENADYTAKILIGQFLAQAAEAALDKSKDWVAAAEAAGAERGIPEFVIRYITDKSEVNDTPDANAELKEILDSRIKRLDAFVTSASAVLDATKRERAAVAETPRKLDS